MHRCYIEPGKWGQVLTPSADEVHHLLKVMRAVGGDAVEVFDGKGRGGVARLQSGATPVLRLEAGSERTEARDPRITLIQAVLKGPRMDGLIEKATELGATAILPVQTRWTVVRVKDGAARRERWERIACGAAKQCGTNWIPEIRPVVSLGEGLRALADCDAAWVGSLDPAAPLMRDVLANVARPRHVALIIGPEGDLSPEELAACARAGAAPVSFGGLVLRAETAALFGLSAVAFAFARKP